MIYLVVVDADTLDRALSMAAYTSNFCVENSIEGFFFSATNLKIVSEHMIVDREQKQLTKKVIYVTRSGIPHGTFSTTIDKTGRKHAMSLQRKAEGRC